MIKQLFSLILSVYAAAVLVTACQDPALEEVPVQEEGIKTIPFSLAVKTEGTKVSYAEGTYQFKEGDKLHVVGVERTDIQGNLTQNGDVWSGYLSYDATEGEPGGDTRLSVTLIHADNTDVSTYASAIVGSVPEGSTLLREAVEHYSQFTTEVTLSTTEALLHQQATFLDVTVTFDFDGSHTVEAGKALVDLATILRETTAETDFVALPGGEDFEVHFMAVVPGDQPISAFTLTIGDRIIGDFADNTRILSANKKYTIERTVVYRPQLGDPLWSDGTYGRLRHADPNASIVGIIVYVNHHYDATQYPEKAAIDDAITEKSAGFGHGLVMALRNVDVGVKWSDAIGKKQCTSGFVTEPIETIAADNLSGYSNTEAIITTLGSDAVSAASRAKAYNVTVSLENTSGWFLPSVGQWMYTISTDGFGGADPADQWLNGNKQNWLSNGTLGNLILVKERADNQVNDLIKALNDRLATLASDFSDKISAADYDVFGDPTAAGNISDNYWTSSELDENSAIRMNLGTVEKKNEKYYSSIKVAGLNKTSTYYSFSDVRYYIKVRPFLAF